MFTFDVNQLTGRAFPHVFWEDVLKRLTRALKLKKNYELSIAVVDAAAIKKLNHVYRGINQATDVLSFGEMSSSVERHFRTKNYLGEVVLCYPQAVKQARRAKHSVHKELELLLVHGVLHLLGYDHVQTGQARRMRQREKAATGVSMIPKH